MLYLGADVLGVDAYFVRGMEEHRDALNAAYDSLMDGTSAYRDPRENNLEIEDLDLPNIVMTEIEY